MPRKQKPTKEHLHKYRRGQKNAAGTFICGAKTREKNTGGTPCQSTVLMTNGRCRDHGGETPTGMAAGNFKGGRWSKFLPEDLAERVQRNLEDEGLLSLRPDIAALDARISQILERNQKGEPGKAWLEARAALVELRASAPGSDDYNKALAVLIASIEFGADEWQGWETVARHWEQRRKLVETETKNLMLIGKYIRVEEVMLLMSALGDSVRRRIDDLARKPELALFAPLLEKLKFYIQEDMIRLADARPQLITGQVVEQLSNE